VLVVEVVGLLDILVMAETVELETKVQELAELAVEVVVGVRAKKTLT
jgi:hypothetical protein